MRGLAGSRAAKIEIIFDKTRFLVRIADYHNNKPINIFNMVYMFLLVGMLFILAFPANKMTKIKLALVLFEIGLMFQMV